LVDGFVEVFCDALLILHGGGSEHIGDQPTGFAQLVVGQRLRLLVLEITGKIQAEQLGGGLNLAHGPNTMSFVIMVARDQDMTGVMQHPGLRRIAERNRLQFVLTGN
jgi:hypothetical protein